MELDTKLLQSLIRLISNNRITIDKVPTAYAEAVAQAVEIAEEPEEPIVEPVVGE